LGGKAHPARITRDEDLGKTLAPPGQRCDDTRVTRVLRRTTFALAAAAMAVSAGTASQPTVTIPEFWSEELLHDYELPLASPENTPKHVSRDYYYALPEHVLYKSYPIYHPSREPAGYLDTLAALEPERTFDPAALKTEADWIAAGRDVFEMPIDYEDAVVSMRLVRDPAWYERHRVPVAADGTMPFARYVIRRKGLVEVGNLSCAMCHTRVMPAGQVVAGAQGNFPVDASSSEVLPSDAGIRFLIRLLTATPWDQALTERTRALPMAQIREGSRVMPPGVSVRQGTSLFAPAAIPDLIGLRDRRYLDRTGLGRHRGPADLMRYAALNQGMDLLSNYGGFVPIATDMKTLPPAGRSPQEVRHPRRAGGRGSDFDDVDTPRHRLLQDSVAEGRVVPRSVRAQRFGGDARRLVQPRAAQGRVRPDRLGGCGREDARRQGTSVRAWALRRRSCGADRLSQDAVAPV
jgi:hypothetical protein